MKPIFYSSLMLILLLLSSCGKNTKQDKSKKSDIVEHEPTTISTDPIPAKMEEPNTLKQPTFKRISTEVFKPQNKKIVLMQDNLSKKLILFQTKLEVNTDGTPLSYHPQDLGGKTKAINTIGNAVAIYKDGMDGNIFLKRGFYGEAMNVFEQYRDSGYKTTPNGYRISWKNVLIPEKINGVEQPCTFKSGKYKGYYASATSLKNGLTADKGECGCNNQVNPLEIPAFVLVGGKNNPLRENGAYVGDLLFAYNPQNEAVSYAIINDVGPRNKLGEGSLLLNKELNGKQNFPKNRQETYNFVTKHEVIIAILPESRKYQVVKPFTAENIKSRITAWLSENGFDNEKVFVEFLKKNKESLK